MVGIDIVFFLYFYIFFPSFFSLSFFFFLELVVRGHACILGR